jgi:hypothetical protein
MLRVTLICAFSGVTLNLKSTRQVRGQSKTLSSMTFDWGGLTSVSTMYMTETFLIVSPVLVSFDMLSRQPEQFRDEDWSVVIVDEVHRIKNPMSKGLDVLSSFKCRRRFGLTVIIHFI